MFGSLYQTILVPDDPESDMVPMFGWLNRIDRCGMDSFRFLEYSSSRLNGSMQQKSSHHTVQDESLLAVAACAPVCCSPGPPAGPASTTTSTHMGYFVVKKMVALTLYTLMRQSLMLISAATTRVSSCENFLRSWPVLFSSLLDLSLVCALVMVN